MPESCLPLTAARSLTVERLQLVDAAVLDAATGAPDEYTADLAESTVDAAQLADELRAHMSALAEEITRFAR